MSCSCNKRRFQKGDVVRVWSLQSFHGGGFLKGAHGIVVQDQMTGSSVLVAVTRTINGSKQLDPSYEVYAEQLEYVSDLSGDLAQRFSELLTEARS